MHHDLGVMSQSRTFSLDYLEHAVLGDGTKVRLRLVRPEDKDVLRAGFDHWSAASRYSRFLTPKASLTDDELRYLCEVDNENHVALGALRDDTAPDASEVGLGIARFIRLSDQPDVAEAAVAVADEAQRKGLGELLLRRLVAAAHERGIARFRFDVLGTNAGIAALLAKVAPERSIEQTAGVMSIEIALPEGAPAVPPPPDLRSFRRLVHGAAENTAEWTGAVCRLWRR
jgi:GNAT superfamily N-acetyltransferase